MLRVYGPDSDLLEEELSFLRTHGVRFERVPAGQGCDELHRIGIEPGPSAPLVSDGARVVVGYDPEGLMAMAADQAPEG